MDIWGDWEFSSGADARLSEICLKLGVDKSYEISNDWMALLKYNSSLPENCQMEIDDSEVDKKDEILKTVKHCIENDTILPEDTFVGTSLNSLSRVLMSVSNVLDEYGFCSFCKFIASWNSDILVEHSLKAVVFEKLKKTLEVSGCVIFSVKELAISKPDEICRVVLIPLLTDETNNFTDVELLSGVFSVLPGPQKDFTIRKFTRKPEFVESDWKLLHPLIKDLSQNSLLNLLDCTEKFAHKFKKSLVFGRFLVNLCKNFEFIGNKDVLREVVGGHETLLKTQAMKYLESV